MTLKAKGVISATGTAFFQGMEAVIFTFFGVWALLGPNHEFLNAPEFSAAALAIKELFGMLFLIIAFRKSLMPSLRAMKQKWGKWLMVSGCFTSVGNLFFFMGIAFAGPSYGVVLITMMPVFSIIVMKTFFKEKQNPLVWSGLIMAVVSGILFLLLPSFFGEGKFDASMLLGMSLSLVAAMCWSMEGIFIKVSNDASGNNMDAKEKLIIRTLTVFAITFILIMPIMCAFHGSGHTTYFWFGKMFTSYIPAIVGVALGVNILLMRACHIYSVTNIGPKLAAVIDTNNFIFPALISEFMSLASNTMLHSLFAPIVWWAWFLLIPIVGGISMVILFDGKVIKKIDKNIFKK